VSKYYVYIYTDPTVPYGRFGLEFSPFYVGKGQGNRYKFHLGCRNRLNPQMNDKVRHMLDNEVDPVIVLVHRTDNEAEAYEVETQWIEKVGRVMRGTGPLLNLTDGGVGTSSGEGHPFYGKTHTESAKRAISIASAGENNPFYGKTHTDGTRAKMRLRVVSEENKHALRRRYKNVSLSESHKANIRKNTPKGEASPLWGTHKSAEEKIRQVLKKAKYRYVIESRYATYIVYSLKVFCRHHELDERALSRSKDGKYAHKGMRMISKEVLPPNWFEDPVLLGEYTEFSKIYEVTPDNYTEYKEAA